ncbi:uncharacterized protein LOC113386508 [Ctenocephalides felis]|uniref:uncharacterized protein LOC113386508 n=1 Tax=Ctenocephalides felis TaxID=7515 RepID=UPI000E6E2BC1|nr:uncharacterized protein LOC113386508 [Ctenocephalides felis]
MGATFNWVFLIAVVLELTTLTWGQSLTSREHRTQAAVERVNDLWCYQCDSMEDGDKCVDVSANHSSTIKKCKDDRRVCMVKRVSYTTSTANSTSAPKLWALERNCTKICEPGCIVIGERTKLYACTSCCEKSLCNVGIAAASKYNFNEVRKILSLFASLIRVSERV